MRAVSACLLGVACRYDGAALPEEQRLSAEDAASVVPLCPEQLGGLPTPRSPAEFVGGDGEALLAGRARLINAAGEDVSAFFVRGAEEAVALCRRLGITEALLKARSPSCGVGCIHCDNELVPGYGVTAALMRRHGIKVICHPD